MQKILLLGKNGQLGKALGKELSGSSDLKSFAKNELDILDFSKVAETCGQLKPDFIVNAAAYTAVDRAETEQALAMKINSEAVGNLAKICKNSGMKLIHFSTDYVFDGKHDEGFEEDDEPKPVNFYGESKLAGEREILDSGCEFAILRTSWLFGDGQNFVTKMLELARKNSEIKVVSDQIGCPTFAKDLAQTTKKIILENVSGIFHVTNSGTTSWADFARKIFEIKNLPTKVSDIPSSEFPTAAQRPKVSILQNTKLPQLRSWEDGLEEYLM
ncbi:dTDP-4-dehydrorhamnose reductase [Candidatus Gracilibacteria bacterium]|nr:dTDP-4-dehydrorhamnose reductase [Candidatus Gracilibacteria bacterium]MCF7856053.1 dTDP-4-dehydrorhamnose reductase [Candidatus Gracilibacteria bacterium]MCF7896392.1 dTDP-4-dehydrorhamnose reductase [Candidatus Gracilibacteria bacterium]